jgi:hypothetical protein
MARGGRVARIGREYADAGERRGDMDRSSSARVPVLLILEWKRTQGEKSVEPSQC